ncbi:thiamine-phosphate kinase [Curvivirga aplysinae]|uniref:thiamine-phosphate kinase n=1 Tax=Curvivirga aplysinae TaxID=2529852 RepID=UPI0012BD03D7|nr:thiamine-phosphate kinase [Curvivirga aplysinae]MTI09624.1 thiamine-phosphate kinase [Curvivirga aplysinae]
MEIGLEFNRIEKFFKPLTEKLSGAFALLDDAAELTFTTDQKIVVTTDTIVEGIHFLGSENPSSIARKLLGVNLSDLAAKGASPHSYSLSLGMPDQVGDVWLREFTSGLSYMQDRYGIVLSGGDSVRVPEQIVLTVTAIGVVPGIGMIRRDTAEFGNDIYVTGFIGDGSLGLLAAQNKLSSDYLADRYYHPQPRIEYTNLLREFATSSMDVSDGLIADTAKLMKASKLSAELFQMNIPLSDEVKKLVMYDKAYLETALTGGDDYEILFTCSSELREALLLRARELNLTISRIGVVKHEGKELVTVIGENEKKLTFQKFGYSHT